MVDLGEHGDIPVLQPFDHPHLPQRLRTIELVGADVADEVAELARPARRGYRDVPDVVVEVELVLLDPARSVEAERHVVQLPPELRQEWQALRGELAQAVERETAGRGR